MDYTLAIGAVRYILKMILQNWRFCFSSRFLLTVAESKLPKRVSTQSFSVSRPTVWNNLSDKVTSAPSLPTFRQYLSSEKLVLKSLSLTLYKTTETIVTLITLVDP